MALNRSSEFKVVIVQIVCVVDVQSESGVVGWCDGPGETSSAGASYNLGDSRARAYCACSRCEWRLFGLFFSSLSFLLFLPLSGRRPDID